MAPNSYAVLDVKSLVVLKTLWKMLGLDDGIYGDGEQCKTA